jgi:hypothetical protein
VPKDAVRLSPPDFTFRSHPHSLYALSHEISPSSSFGLITVGDARIARRTGSPLCRAASGIQHLS